ALSETHNFTISGTQTVTINGGLGVDTVEFIGNYLVPNSNLTVNAEHIKVDPGVSVCVGDAGNECGAAPTARGNITFNAVDKDNGISIFGITTTIPVIGTDGLVDISADKGAWDSGSDYDAGDVVVDPIDGNQYRAQAHVSKGGSAPSADALHTSWALAGTTILNGDVIRLTAFAGSVTGTASNGGSAQTLSSGGDLILAAVDGFAETGSFTAPTGPSTTATCSYATRDIANHKLTGLSGGGCTGSVADGATV